ncbi:hypothetical protein MA16_Dca025697 [Dendrobium catenatum]|uniref:B3 domain-containing protein n=1 Tax=Dendrobium catenatum TaxID=906689 RepID=A0A2I0VYW3_9ASPA|nr:hypothetical protein MA16_Dca025697 [Dendrobium catenatum]
MVKLPTSPFFPHWARSVAEVNHAFGFKFLTVKKVDASDISVQHNCFLLPRDVVENKLVLNLTYQERQKASLLTIHDWRWRDNQQTSYSSDRRNNDGLNVSIYVKGGWRFQLLLTHNDESGDTVIRGNELELVRRFGNIKEGDDVAIWVMRHIDHVNNKSMISFCFVKIDWSLMIAATELRLAVF